MQNLKYYYSFFIFNGISVAVAANPLFFDKILLEMKINLSAFGWIKGLSFFSGVFACMLISHLLQNLSREREVVIAAYGIRILLPLLLIVSTLFFESKVVLTVIMLINTAFCYFFAIAANVSLDVLLKKISKSDDLSKNTGYALSLNRLSCGAFAVLMAWSLALLEKQHSFVFSYCALLLICGFFHIPASIALLKIKTLKSKISGIPKILDVLIPVKDKNYLQTLGITFCTYIFFGAISAYLFPYLLKVIKIKFSHLIIFDLIISGAAIFISSKWGSLYDKYGHRKVLNIIVCGVIIALFFLFGQTVACALLFSLLAWAGASGLFASGLMVVQRSLSIKKSCPMKANIYIASTNLFAGTGFLAGNIAASIIFSAAKNLYPSVNDVSAYCRVFAFLFIPCLGILFFNNFRTQRQSSHNR